MPATRGAKNSAKQKNKPTQNPLEPEVIVVNPSAKSVPDKKPSAKQVRADLLKLKQNQEKQLAELNAKLQQEYDREAAKLKAKGPVKKNPTDKEAEDDIRVVDDISGDEASNADVRKDFPKLVSVVDSLQKTVAELASGHSSNVDSLHKSVADLRSSHNNTVDVIQDKFVEHIRAVNSKF